MGGLRFTLRLIAPLLEAAGGPIADRARVLGILPGNDGEGDEASLDLSSRVQGGDPTKGSRLGSLSFNELKRGLSQMIQELILVPVKEQIFPLLDGSVMDLVKEQSLPKIIGKKIRGLVFDIVEGLVRSLIHS